MVHVSRKTAEELLHQDVYTPHELADLLETSVDLILHEIWSGRLKARRFGRDTLDIKRNDALHWLDERRHRA